MEGVPRLPMLAFELKSFSDHVDYTTPLKSYISEFYSENAELYNKECFELDQLRKLAVSSSVDFMGCSNMKKYYCQIEFLLSRFPMMDGGSIQIPFTWEDMMNQQMVTFTDIKFEQASILFNIGCLHSRLGSMDNRTTPEGMKVSCTHFQCAAWMFQHLRDAFDSFKCLDFNRDLLSFMSTVMLAQAQECILEKSMTDNRKSSITAKVAAQIVEYYKMAIKHLNIFTTSTSVNSKIIKEWKRRMDLKMSLYECITMYYMGLNAEELNKWGERLSYMQAAMLLLEDLIKNNKLDDGAVDESLKFMVDVIGGKLNSAKKDNDFIYHDKVPNLDSLPEVKSASLVKGIPLNVNDPEVSGEDIFKKLVPFVVHQKSSLYSEEKAKLLRKIGADIELKNLELKNFLSLLQLSPSDHILPESTKIPDVLLEKCASMSVRPTAIKDLINAMQVLSSRSTDVEGDLDSTLKVVDFVEEAIHQISKTYGVQMDGLKECEDIRKECKKYEDTLKSTSQLNEELHGIMEIHISNLKMLSSPVQDVYAAISSLQYTPTESELEILQDMKKLMEKVDHMTKQRIQLEEKLRQQIQKDDITQILVVASSDINYEGTFKEHLEKHVQQVGLINQNLAAQSNIFHALTEANAKYTGVRKSIMEASQRQQSLIDGMVKSYVVYEDLLSKTQQGVDLYDKLAVHISKLLEQAQNLHKSHQAKEAKIREKSASQIPVVQGNSSSISGDSNTKEPQLKPLDMCNTPLRLKDYLPFMKPDTFGTRAGLPNVLPDNPVNSTVGVPQIPSLHSTSLPNSHAASPLRVNYSSQPEFNPGTSSLTNISTPINQPSSSYHSVSTPYSQTNLQIQQKNPTNIPFIGSQPFSGSLGQGVVMGSPGQGVAMGSVPFFTRNHDGNFSHINPQQINQQQINPQQVNQQQINQITIPSYVGMRPVPPRGLTDQRIQYCGSQLNQPRPHPTDQSQITFQQQMQQPGIHNPMTFQQQMHPQQQYVHPPSSQFHQKPPTTHQTMTTPQNVQEPHQHFQQPYQYFQQSLQTFQQPQQTTELQLNLQQQIIRQQQPQHNTQQQLNFQQQQNIQQHLNFQQQLNIRQQQPQQQLNFQQQSIRQQQAQLNFQQPQQNTQQQLNFQQQQNIRLQQPQQNFQQTLPAYQNPIQQSFNLQQPQLPNHILPSSIGPQSPQQEHQRFAGPQFPTFSISQFSSILSLHSTMNSTPRQPAPTVSMVLSSPSVQPELGQNNFMSPDGVHTSIDQPRKTSLDEMLSSGNNLDQQSSVLIPKVITVEDLKREQNEEAKKNLKLNAKDPFSDCEVLSKFVSEVEKFSCHVDELCKPSLDKMTTLEKEWKELNELQDKSTKVFSMAIARCYPLKNRQHDVMPFDNSRVRLVGATDDYINASLIKSISLACPDIIATQSPLPVTFSDFWQMVYDYNVEVIVMLCSESEASTKGQVYWPTDKGQKATISGNFAVTLHSIHIRAFWTERVIGIMNSKSQVSRSVIHLNFHSWSQGSEPDNCDGLLQFITYVHSLYLQQRSLMKPIVVHCSNGIGRTGTFAVIYTGMQEMNHGSGIIDICKTINLMRVQRKYFVEFERQLKFCYTTILQHAQNVLRNYGIQSVVTQSVVSQDHPKNLNSKTNIEVIKSEAINMAPKEILTTSSLEMDVVYQDNKDELKQQTSSEQQQPIVVPSFITDVQNPDKFSLDCKASRNKVTKINFFNQTGLLGNKPLTADPLDPLNELDPLWTMKK